MHLVTVDGTFLFIDPDRGPHFSRSVAFAPRVLAALRHDRIGVHALCPVSVHVFSSGDHFKEYCAAHDYLPGSGRDLGVYDHRRGVILTDLSGGEAYVFTIGHELAHVLMDADVEPDGTPRDRTLDHIPLWFRECVTSLYESPVLPADGEIHGTDDWRYLQLRPAVAARDPAARLGALFGMSDYDFRGGMDAGGIDLTRTLLHRATARATCQWLDGQGQLWPLYRGWRDGRAADPDGVATFTRVTGRAPTDPTVNEDWRKWVKRTR